MTFGPRVPHCCCAWPRLLPLCSWDVQAPRGPGTSPVGEWSQRLPAPAETSSQAQGQAPQICVRGAHRLLSPEPGRASADIPPSRDRQRRPKAAKSQATQGFVFFPFTPSQSRETGKHGVPPPRLLSSRLPWRWPSSLPGAMQRSGMKGSREQHHLSPHSSAFLVRCSRSGRQEENPTLPGGPRGPLLWCI